MPQLIDDLTNQNYIGSLEFILVDDESTDQTKVIMILLLKEIVDLNISHPNKEIVIFQLRKKLWMLVYIMQVMKICCLVMWTVEYHLVGLVLCQAISLQDMNI